MSKNNVHIALLIMVKNEKKRLHITLNSVIGFVDSIVAYDTGSTDNTIEILQNFSKEHNIPLHLKKGEFVNFSVSRNVSLDFADTFPEIDFLLLLDVNDELRGGDHLRKICEKVKSLPSTGFLCCQEWWSGKYDRYYNIRLVKAREGWRYKGSVHEWMVNTKKYEEGKQPTMIRLPDNVVIYQDRTKDDDKTGKRFKRDKELLLKDHQKNPEETRTLFYLAQTCACLKELEESLYYYKLRSELDGFQEEKFHALLRCGNLSQSLGHDWYDSMTYYIKALEHSKRAEPAIKIAEHYINTQDWVLAFTFADLSCKLTYPEHSMLFVDKHAYDYTRWHILGIIAYYVGEYNAGKVGCINAIKCGLNCELDQANLKFYLDKEKELGKSFNGPAPPDQTKKIFMTKVITEIEKENPKWNRKQVLSKANKIWKNHRKRS